MLKFTRKEMGILLAKGGAVDCGDGEQFFLMMPWSFQPDKKSHPHKDLMSYFQSVRSSIDRQTMLKVDKDAILKNIDTIYGLITTIPFHDLPLYLDRGEWASAIVAWRLRIGK